MPSPSGSLSLSPADRDLLALVARAVVTNPFSDERAELDARITGVSIDEPHAARTARVLEVVGRRLQALEREGKADLRRYEERDREIISFALLFDIYHRFKDALDGLILDQIETGDTPCPVPFARDVLGQLTARGFDKETASRNLAMFYQLRRAFYFIDRALVGQSASMKKLRLSLWNNIFTSDMRWYDRYLWNRMEDFSTLLLGETGTGKGTAAAAIGRSGFIPFDEKRGRFVESFTRAFVPLNLSQFPEQLLESELFGHAKGSFTGALDDHEGVFSACSPHGAIFLDEIGEVSAPVQIKLLQVLQERVFSPVGSHQAHRFHGRVIAATNRNLVDLRAPGGFRDDFFYRLCSDVIVVPPLRHRLAEDRAELARLLEHTIHRLLGQPSGEMVALVRDTIEHDIGAHYPWPGNVRELEQCTRRILLKKSYEGDTSAVTKNLRDSLLDAVDRGSVDAEDLVCGYCALLHDRHGTYEEVARRTGLDRRTVKKYALRWKERHPEVP